MVALPKHVQAAMDAEKLTDDGMDSLLHAIADHRYRAFLRQRRAARIALAREWAVAIAATVCAVWAIRHWRFP